MVGGSTKRRDGNQTSGLKPPPTADLVPDVPLDAPIDLMPFRTNGSWRLDSAILKLDWHRAGSRPAVRGQGTHEGTIIQTSVQSPKDWNQPVISFGLVSSN